jgi:3-hydroxybutyryl-CoA dehydratase
VRATVGERFSKEVALTPAIVAAFSQAAGDTNPIHFDPAYAATTRFGKVIASGTHTSSLLLGLTAAHFSTRGSVVGLEFTVTFRRAVFADERVRIEWDVLGRLIGQDGAPSVEAKGRVLVSAQL